MTDLFHIDEPDIANQTTDAPQVWYIKEGDFIHCTCSSEEVAKLSLEHFKKLHLKDASLKKNKIEQETLIFEEHVFIAETELAVKAFEEVKTTLETNSLLKKLKKSFENQKDTAPIKDRKNKKGLKG
jgi:hypothetical protein